MFRAVFAGQFEERGASPPTTTTHPPTSTGKRFTKYSSKERSLGAEPIAIYNTGAGPS